MAYTKSFEVGGVKYHAMMASAVGQDELLSLLTQPIMQRFAASVELEEEFDEAYIMPMFMAMHTQVKQRVAEILLEKVMLDGQVPVSIKDFSGKMVNYNTLLAKLLIWNLTDFFTWLPSALKKDVATKNQNDQ